MALPSSQKGFTFIELLVTLAIVGILAGVGGVTIHNLIADQDQTATPYVITSLVTASTAYARAHQIPLAIVRSSDVLQTTDISTSAPLTGYSIQLPLNTSSDMPQGTVWFISSTGLVSLPAGIPIAYTFTAPRHTYLIRVAADGSSLIQEQ